MPDPTPKAAAGVDVAEIIARMREYSQAVLDNDPREHEVWIARDMLTLLDELDCARAAIRRTHTHYCTEDWTIRNMHAPECLLYEIEQDVPRG